MTVIIGLVAFALGWVVRSFFDHSDIPETSNYHDSYDDTWENGW